MPSTSSCDVHDCIHVQATIARCQLVLVKWQPLRKAMATLVRPCRPPRLANHNMCTVMFHVFHPYMCSGHTANAIADMTKYTF